MLRLAAALALVVGCAPTRPAETTPEPTAPTESAPAREPPPKREPIPTAAQGEVRAIANTRLPRHVISTRGRIYWTNGAGEMSSVAIVGGEVTIHHQTGGGDRALARVVTYDRGAVYFTTQAGIHRLLLGQVKARLFIDVPDALYITAGSDDHLYFTRFMRPGIWRVPASGGIPVRVARSKRPSSLIFRNGFLYWTSYSEGSINRLELRTGRKRVLARSRRPTALAVVGNRIVWATEKDGGVHTKEIGSRRRHRTIVRGAKNHDIFASDDTFVYWGSWQPRGKGQVSRVRVAGGREEVLATELRSPVGVAVVGNQLAVANKGEDTILLVDLPR